jgi:hypothetical protein
MLLMRRDDTMKVPVIEHQIYMCSACRHIARRLVFKRAKMPVTHLPVIAVPIDKLWKERVAPKTWGTAVEKLRSKQAALAGQAAIAKLAAPVQVPASPPT